MSHRRDSGGDVVHVIPTNHPPENWFPTGGDASMWATEEDYAADTPPPSKKPRGDSPATSNRAKAIGKMFFKTKLCCKFRAGTCPYVTNCNFAHSVEELRRPPANWQQIVAAHDEEKAVVVTEPAREEFQIPSLVSSAVNESGRSYKGRHCKKFYTEEGCPYGDSCTFLHDEASRNRESVAISLGPGGYGGVGAGGAGAGGGGGGAGQNLKPSNWKTRICNKWELTGYCPFGAKCHFAHGAAELHRFAGGLAEGEAKDVSAVHPDSKQSGVASKVQADTVTILPSALPHADIYHAGVPPQRPPSIVIQKAGIRAHQKWKGPEKISRIYGDWIDDIE